MGWSSGKKDRIKMNIEAMITSVDDPQMDRCLESVRNQTIPFSNIIHINNVSPLSEAFNKGMSQSTEDWVMDIGGDMILDKDALERIIQYMGQRNGDRILGYYLGLRDTFLHSKIGYVSVLKGSLFREVILDDSYSADRKPVRNLRSAGWTAVKNLHFLVGTHFDQPDEFQVFRRFYLHGVRYPSHKSIRPRLKELYEKTGNSLYKVGIKANEYGALKRFYPGGHNIDFDRKNFEEFKNEC